MEPDYSPFLTTAARTEVASPIEAAMLRVAAATDTLHKIASAVECHADRLFGECPKAGSDSARPQPVRSGLMGGLEDALDRLDEAKERVSEACRRNCTLA